MKKYFYMAISICILCLCGGCSSKTETQELGVDVKALYDTDQEYSAQSYWGNNNHKIKKADNGYYFIEDSLLYFWDPETKDGTVVCSAPNCNHQDSDCNAYLGDFGDQWQNGFDKYGLEIFNNHIYIREREIKDNVMDFYAYQFSMDGSERKKMGYLFSKKQDPDGGYSSTYEWLMLDGYYYGVIDSDDDTYGLSKIRLDGKRHWCMI
jgi:hypothetical protein